MPELPEVEIVKQSLSKKLEHKKIKKIILVSLPILVFIIHQAYQKNIIMLKFILKV